MIYLWSQPTSDHCLALPCLSLVHSLLDLTDMFQVAAEDTLELNTSWLC